MSYEFKLHYKSLGLVHLYEKQEKKKQTDESGILKHECRIPDAADETMKKKHHPCGVK